jgi:hypothetical protein
VDHRLANLPVSVWNPAGSHVSIQLETIRVHSWPKPRQLPATNYPSSSWVTKSWSKGAGFSVQKKICPADDTLKKYGQGQGNRTELGVPECEEKFGRIRRKRTGKVLSRRKIELFETTKLCSLRV